MYEVEQKFSVAEPAQLEAQLKELGALPSAEESQVDVYFNHPCRDFVETHEALRIRRSNGVPSITYKGPKLPGAVKARRELEWRLDPGDADGGNFETLLETLGFTRVATVAKQRRSFVLSDSVGPITVAIDHVEGLGGFAEIELVAGGQEHVEAARQRINALARTLALRQVELKSYLTLIVERQLGDT